MSEIGITQLEADLMKKCKELEEENKTLKECNKSQSEVINNVFIPQKERLEEENKTLKDNVEFLHSCLDDRDKSIAIMQEENKKLREIMRDVLYRTTKHNIKNVVYKGEKIEIGNGDYDYTLD